MILQYLKQESVIRALRLSAISSDSFHLRPPPVSAFSMSLNRSLGFRPQMTQLLQFPS